MKKSVQKTDIRPALGFLGNKVEPYKQESYGKVTKLYLDFAFVFPLLIHFHSFLLDPPW